MVMSLSVLQSTEFSETPSPDSDSVNSLEGHSEPSWFKDIKFDDSDTEQLVDETEYAMPSMYCVLYFFFFFLFDACSHTLLSYMLWFGMCWLDSHLQLPVSLCLDSAGPSKRTSVSSFQSVVDSDSAASINLNMEQNNVNFHIKKQSKNPSVSSATEQKCKYSHSMFCIIYARLLC